MQNNNDVEQ